MSALAETPRKFDLYGEIDALLRRGASDPRRIAGTLAARLSPEQAADFAREWIACVARLRMGEHRRGVVTRLRAASVEATYVLNTDRFAMSRVDIGADAFAKYALLTAAECIQAAEFRERMAQGNIREADRFRALAAAIKKHGVKRVRDLPQAVIVEILK